MQNLFGGSSSQNQSQSSTTPVSMTPAPYRNLQGPVATQLQNLFSGGPVYSGIGSAFGPLSTSPSTGGVDTFSASMTPNESAVLGQIMNSGSNPNLGGIGSATNYINTVLNPNFTNPQSNPMLQSAISGAIQPMIDTYKNVTLPNLQSSFVANGQVLNGPAQVGVGASANGAGSSAFDKAAAISQQGLLSGIGQATTGLEQQAMGQQQAAASQAPLVSSTSLNDLVTNLQSQALPRLIQQYGMDQGLQEFNNRVNTMMQALGLSGSISGPDTAESSQSSSSGNYSMASGGAGNMLGQLAGSSGLMNSMGFGGSNPMFSSGGWFGSLFGGGGGSVPINTSYLSSSYDPLASMGAGGLMT